MFRIIDKAFSEARYAKCGSIINVLGHASCLTYWTVMPGVRS
jgi:hypothetical protein